MNSKKYNRLVVLADQALRRSEILQGTKICKSYNGQVAALGVSVIMSGLLPTIAIYYQDYKEDSKKAQRRNVLNVIAKMMKGDDKNGRDLFNEALDLKAKNEVQRLSVMKADIIDCSVALKQVIRTYTLVDDIEEGEENGKE